MNIAENVENKLWDMKYSLPYTHAKKHIFKPMTGSVSKWKGTKRFFKRNINEKTKDSTAVASSSTYWRNVDNVTKLHLLLVSEPESVCTRKMLFCVKNKGK